MSFDTPPRDCLTQTCSVVDALADVAGHLQLAPGRSAEGRAPVDGLVERGAHLGVDLEEQLLEREQTLEVVSTQRAAVRPQPATTAAAVNPTAPGRTSG